MVEPSTDTTEQQAMQMVLWSVGIKAATGDRARLPSGGQECRRVPHSSMARNGRDPRAGSKKLIGNLDSQNRAPVPRSFFAAYGAHMLRILDTAIPLTFYTIIVVAAVLVFGAFFRIIDTINRFHYWLRGKRYRSMFAALPKRRKGRWWWQAAYHRPKPPA